MRSATGIPPWHLGEGEFGGLGRLGSLRALSGELESKTPGYPLGLRKGGARIPGSPGGWSRGGSDAWVTPASLTPPKVWVYARLYRSVPRFRRPELLEAARAGE